MLARMVRAVIPLLLLAPGHPALASSTHVAQAAPASSEVPFARRQVDALLAHRTKLDNDLTALGERTASVIRHGNALEALSIRRPEEIANTAGGPRVLASGSFRGLSFHCTRAEQIVGEMQAAAREASTAALEVMSRLDTQEEPPRSTPAMREAAGLMVQIKGYEPKMRSAAASFKQNAAGLAEAVKGLQAAAAAEPGLEARILAYDRATTELRTFANQLADDARRFEERKDAVRDYLMRLRGRAAPADQGKVDDLVSEVDRTLAPVGAGRLIAARTVVSGSDALVAGARASVKLAFDRVRSDAAACTALGADPAQEAVRRAADARNDFAATLDAIVFTYGRRVSRVADMVKLGRQIVTDTGPKQVHEARARGDRAAQTKAEALVKQAQELTDAAEREARQLADTRKTTVDLKRAGDEMRLLDIGPGP